MTTEKQIRDGFSKRLNAVLDRAGVPVKGKGRQTAVAKEFDVTQKGARKWLEGESIPKTTTIARIVERYKITGVTLEWLMDGNNECLPWDEIGYKSLDIESTAFNEIEKQAIHIARTLPTALAINWINEGLKMLHLVELLNGSDNPSYLSKPNKNTKLNAAPQAH